MSNKLLTITLLILLVAIAVVIYTKSEDEEPSKLSDISLSFICENEHHFIAEFDINLDTLRVLEGGLLTHQIPRTDEVLIRFSDSDVEYSFAGEEARVLNKLNNQITRCHQPFDPNNAPYNFGDLGEGGGEDQDATAAVNQNILGSWVSLDDEKFTREFKSDGIVIDSYENNKVSEGPWTIFTSESGIATEFPQSPDIIYLRIVNGPGAEDVLYFSLAKLTPEELELIYMNRGNILRFTRVE